MAISIIRKVQSSEDKFYEFEIKTDENDADYSTHIVATSSYDDVVLYDTILTHMGRGSNSYDIDKVIKILESKNIDWKDKYDSDDKEDLHEYIYWELFENWHNGSWDEYDRLDSYNIYMYEHGNKYLVEVV